MLFAFALVLCFVTAWIQVCVAADQSYAPDEPIASIDGQPVFLGELNLILAERLGVKKQKLATVEVRQAATAILIRRHLAMRTLRSKAGASLDVMIKKEADQFATELQRRGSSLNQFAEERMADQRSLMSDLAWQTAWRQYMKSLMSEENLRKYFLQQRTRYDGSRWNISHLFVPTTDHDSASIKATSDRITDLANELRAAASAEESFEAAAREYSQAGSAAEGGKVGWVQHEGDLPHSVMQAVRNSLVGEIAGPIRSPLGFHLLFVHEFQQGTTSFEELIDQSHLRRDAADMLFESLIHEQKQAKLVWHLEELHPPIPLP
jgi:parvulin-like peptidyl-prolyl isomerase